MEEDIDYFGYGSGPGFERSPGYSQTGSRSELALPAGRAVLGMTDQQRLALLTSKNASIPVRRVATNPEEDPFGLLQHEDTYGALAKTIFDECEGMYHQLARANPVVRKAYAKASKHMDKLSAVEFPQTKLMGIYEFGMSRSSTPNVTQYTFARKDNDDRQLGFQVMRNPSGNYVLKRLDDGIEQTDAQYFTILRSAQSWVEDYAAQLNIQPKSLLDFAAAVPIPYTLKNRAIGRLAKTLTVERVTDNGARLGRRPRWLAVVALAAVIPVSSTPEVAGEWAALGVVHGVGDIFTSSSRHAAAVRQAELKHEQQVIERYDAYDLQLSASSSIAAGSSAPVDYEPSLNPAIEKAPNFPSQAGTGDIRHMTGVDIVYKDGFDGLVAHACAAAVSLPKGTTAVRVANVSPGSAHELNAAVSNTQLEICNDSRTDISSSALDGLYIQPLK